MFSLLRNYRNSNNLTQIICGYNSYNTKLSYLGLILLLSLNALNEKWNNDLGVIHCRLLLFVLDFVKYLINTIIINKNVILQKNNILQYY